jgi:hypothetical protein
MGMIRERLDNFAWELDDHWRAALCVVLGGVPFPGGLRQGFNFPGAPEPTCLDFLYVSFTVGLTYAMSDVSVTNDIQRRMVLFHRVISFFFYSTVVGVVLNAVATS